MGLKVQSGGGPWMEEGAIEKKNRCIFQQPDPAARTPGDVSKPSFTELREQHFMENPINDAV